MAVNTSLPQKVPPKMYIPTDNDIKVLLSNIDDDDMMIAVLLAAFGPLRRSEICGLEDTDIVGNVAHIQRAVVLDENRKWVDKTTKSVAGNRYIPLPDFVCARMTGRKGRIVHFQHALGVPDAYIMQRGGWGSDTVLKQIYRHALSDKTDEMNNIANAHFSLLCNTK